GLPFNPMSPPKGVKTPASNFQYVQADPTSGTTSAPLMNFPALPGLGADPLLKTSHLVPSLNAGTDAGGNGSDRAVNYYYVFGNLAASPGPKGNVRIQPGTTPPPGPNIDPDFQPPQVETMLDLTAAIDSTPGLGQGTGKYYWLYLRRPANPFD